MDKIITEIMNTVTGNEIQQTQAQFEAVVSQPGHQAIFVMIAVDELI